MSEPEQRNIRILLADDHRVLMEGFALIIGRVPHMVVVGMADGPAAALELALQEKPDVVVLDIGFERGSGNDVIADLVEKAGSKVLILTGIDQPALHREALLKGASGVIMKGEAGKKIVAAIEKVYEGEVWVSDITIKSMLKQLEMPATKAAETLAERQETVLLTKREREIVAALFSHGASTNQEVAQRLRISQSTLKNHLRSIYGKLKIKNRVQLMKYALANGFVESRR